MATSTPQTSPEGLDPAPPTPPGGTEADRTVTGRIIAGSCPFCGVVVAVDGSRSRHRQHCHACGKRLRKLRRIKKRHEPAGFTSEGLLEERHRERVWMPMTGVALAVVLAAVFGLWVLWRPETKSATLVMNPPGSLEAIKALVARFTVARTPDEVLPLIRKPEYFATHLRDWCAAHPGALPPGGTLLRIITKQVGETRIAETTMRFDPAPARNLLCVETAAGWRLDWRAYTGLGDMSLADFTTKRPSAPTLLMTVARLSDFYNGNYANPTVWRCLSVTDAAGGDAIFAYVPRGNLALMEKIDRLKPARSLQTAELDRVSRSLALRVHVAPDAAATDPLQVEVDAVEGEGWFVP